MKKNEIKDAIEDGAILSRVIIELQGAPKEHISKTMDLVINKLSTDFEVIKTDKNDTVEMEGSGGVFCAFTEFEILFNTMDAFVGFCFDFAPTSIEIIEPEHFNLDAHAVSGLLNDVVNKIHMNGNQVKELTFENNALKYNASAFLRNLLIVGLAHKDRTLEELSGITGVKSKELKPILDQLVEKKELSINQKNYSLVREGQKAPIQTNKKQIEEIKINTKTKSIKSKPTKKKK